jgi:hypothetical protein
MPTGPQRHPSRDPKPIDYMLNPNEEGQLYIKGHGRYTEKDLRSYAKSFGDDPNWDESKAFFAGPGGNLQGALFDADKWERAQATKLGHSRLRAQSYEGEEIRDTAISRSEIPTSHLQPRLMPSGREAPESEFILKNEDTSPFRWRDIGGYYRGPRGSIGGIEPDVVAVRNEEAVVHELGHRRHLGTTPEVLTTHPRGINPDPLMEGVADAYEDRYGGARSNQVRQMSRDIEHSGRKFPSYQYTGYSTDLEAAEERGWTASDRALYAAVRAHASETGEQPTYVHGREARDEFGVVGGRHDATVDATLHHLLSTSPHAAQALRQTGLKDVGAAAFRRHRDRQLLAQGQNIQESLFSEMKGVESGKSYGFTSRIDAMPEGSNWLSEVERSSAHMEGLEAEHGEWVVPHHMSYNQFGEKPRTQADVAQSLGAQRQHAEKRGFTSH